MSEVREKNIGIRKRTTRKDNLNEYSCSFVLQGLIHMGHKDSKKEGNQYAAPIVEVPQFVGE